MFSRDILAIDAHAAASGIEAAIRDQVRGVMRRRGAVVGISGGVDSSVVAALCARALGPDRVLGLIMPDRDSSPDSERLARELAAALGIGVARHDITPIVAAFGCYDRQLEAIRSVCPEYGEGWRMKLAIPSILASDRLNITRLVTRDPEGNEATWRLSREAYLAMVAATNFKQRTRKMLEYFHADRLEYAVAGTPNLLEYDQGFFVKLGDGAADFKPIAHLYKSQVYALARALGVPAAVTARPPTTDTFPLAQTQEEFYFSLPYQAMDLCLYALDHGVSADEAAPVLGITAEQVARVYRDIEAKRRVSRYLHMPPLLVEPAR